MNWSNQQFKASLALGCAVLILGFSAIFVSWANAPGVITAFYRMAISSVLVAIPFLVRSKKHANPNLRKGLFYALLGGVFISLDMSLWAAGINLSGAAMPTLMANTAPLWVGVGAWLIFREKQNLLFWTGLLAAMLGTAIVMGGGLALNTDSNLGTLFGLLAGIFYGAYFLVTQRGRAYLNTLTYYWVSVTFSSVILLAACLILKVPLSGYALSSYLSFMALGVIVQVIGWLLINYSQGTLPASVVSPTLLGQPVITAIVAVPLLGETLSWQQILGGLIVISGVYIVHHSRKLMNR
jgi:drug/metabolite transporter (DMT)-like permease